MWIPEDFVDNDLFEMIRDEGGDQVRPIAGQVAHVFFRKTWVKGTFSAQFCEEDLISSKKTRICFF